MSRKNALCFIVIILAFISCNKDNGPYYTNAEGKVFNLQDSILIPNVTFRILNWDGDKNHDTTVLHQFSGDSSGYYRLDFEVKNYTEFFFIEAEKIGYQNSKKIQIDGRSTNSQHIYVTKNNN